MKYFNNIKSLKDLKEQYRKLAIANHPDKGGDTDAMQAINDEFDQLFAIWKNRKDDNFKTMDGCEEQTETTSYTYRRTFYEEQGWTGSRRSQYVSASDTCKKVKEYAKAKWPQWTFNCHQGRATWTPTIALQLMSGPYPAFKEGEHQGLSTIASCVDRDTKHMTPEAAEVLCDVTGYLNSFNYDHSDSMTDYFDVGFYTSIGVGSSRHPYEVKVNRLFRMAGDHPENFKWKDGPAHRALKAALKDGEFGMEEFSGGKNLMVYGNWSYNWGKHFHGKMYSQSSIIKKVMQRMTDAGLKVHQWSWYIVFDGYTEEMERALAAEDVAKEKALKEFEAKQKAKAEGKTKTEAKTETSSPSADITPNLTLDTTTYDKYIVVVGDSRQYVKQMQGMGGWYNRKFKCGAGWMFKKEKQSEVEQFIKSVA